MRPSIVLPLLTAVAAAVFACLWLQPEAPPAFERVLVRVIDVTRPAIEGADLLAWSLEGDPGRERRATELELVRLDEPAGFHVLIPADRAGPIVLMAEAPGYVPRTLEVPATRRSSVSWVALTRGPAVVARLLTHDGRPLGGQTVAVDYEPTHKALPAERFVTAGDGSICVAPIEGHSLPARIGFELDGIGSRWFELLPDGGPLVDLGDVVLEGAGRIAGRVVVGDGTPVQGMQVRITAVDPRADVVGYTRRTLTTGEDGVAAFEGLQPGRFRVELSDPGSSLLVVESNFRWTSEATTRADGSVESWVVNRVAVNLTADEWIAGSNDALLASMAQDGDAPRVDFYVHRGAPSVVLVPVRAPRIVATRTDSGRTLVAEIPAGLPSGRFAAVLTEFTGPTGALELSLSGGGDAVGFTSIDVEALDGTFARRLGRAEIAGLARGPRGLLLDGIPVGRHRVTATVGRRGGRLIDSSFITYDSELSWFLDDRLGVDRGAGGRLLVIHDRATELEPRPALERVFQEVTVEAGQVTSASFDVVDGTSFELTVTFDGERPAAAGDSNTAEVRIPALGPSFVAGTSIDKSALFPWALAPGEFAIEVTAEGFRPATAVFVIDGSTLPRVVVNLEAAS